MFNKLQNQLFLRHFFTDLAKNWCVARVWPGDSTNQISARWVEGCRRYSGVSLTFTVSCDDHSPVCLHCKMWKHFVILRHIDWHFGHCIIRNMIILIYHSVTLHYVQLSCCLSAIETEKKVQKRQMNKHQYTPHTIATHHHAAHTTATLSSPPRRAVSRYV